MKGENRIASINSHWSEKFKAMEAFYTLKKNILISVPGKDFSEDIKGFERLMLMYASFTGEVELEVVLLGGVEDIIVCRRRLFIT
ncbi:hypothetical protein HBI24_200650 [Parastagonospora nodorum]|nr:hypothetical protein HBI24_200650 [Parastagonospora nodorum]